MPPPATLDFETLYREHFVFVWRSLYRLGVREADVPDACQEVFLVAHRRLPEFEGRAKVTTWLFRICLRVASGSLRRAHVKREVLDEAALESELSADRDPESSRAHGEGLRLLEVALDALSLEQRTVFVLFELEGFTSTEIAETLELPLGTVYSRLRAARERFEQRLKRRANAGLPLLTRETT
jgi:RNA polymerase sigma-70 factor (ECF subfamily)